MLRRAFSFTFSLLFQLYAISHGFCVCLPMPSSQTRIKISKLLHITFLSLSPTLLIPNYAKVQVSVLFFDFYFKATIIIETSQPVSQSANQLVREVMQKIATFCGSRSLSISTKKNNSSNIYTSQQSAKKRVNGYGEQVACSIGCKLDRISKAANILRSLIKTSTI